METRVFVVNLDLLHEHQNARGYMHLTDEEFMSLSEEQGATHSVIGFQEAFNNSYISTENCVIRILEVGENKELQSPLQDIYSDIQLLKSGDWVPDDYSCEASLGSIRRIAESLDIELKENKDGTI